MVVAATTDASVDETPAHMAFPRKDWVRSRTNHLLEQIVYEIRRRTCVLGNFPKAPSALMPVAAGRVPCQPWRPAVRVAEPTGPFPPLGIPERIQAPALAIG
ncbi:MAG TPA: transposase [Pirellulales bacterium]|nr:transposase [Pirellulales bacterium]